MSTSTLPKIETITPHPEISDELAKAAKALNSRTKKSDQAWAELLKRREQVQAGGVAALAESVASGTAADIALQEHEILTDRIQLHHDYRDFAAEYQAGLQSIREAGTDAINEAREGIQAALEGIGYNRFRAPGVNPRSCWQPAWIESHPTVLQAVSDFQNVTAGFNAHAFRQKHDAALKALDSHLTDLRSRLAAMSGIPAETEAEQPASPVVIHQGRPVERQTTGDFDGMANRPTERVPQ